MSDLLTWAMFWQGAATVATLVTTWMIGNKHRHAPTVGLAGQGAWAMLIYTNETWGLIPVTIAMVYLNARTLILWRRDARKAAAQ